MTTRGGNLRRGTTPASLALSTSNFSEKSNNTGPSGSSSNINNNNNNSGTGATPGKGAGRANVSLEEWERNTPLTELQLRSVSKLTKWNESGRRDIPLKFADEPGHGSGSGTSLPTPVAQHRLLQQRDLSIGAGAGSPISRSSTPTAGPSRSEHALLHPAHSIQTPQHFYDWYALVDRSVAHSQEAHYRAHVASLEGHLAVCDLLLDRIGFIETEVDGMMEGWRGVEEGGRSLKGACERLLEERDGLVEMVDDIGAHLEYFQELDGATRMLNHPGEEVIFQPDFLYMVERVDICIDFLRAHRHYREAEVYLLRFQQCMTRAMTLIKMNFVGSFRALSAEISKRLSEDISPTAQHHLLYTRFKTTSTRLSPLLRELERRARAHPAALAALLTECHTAYLATRKALLVPRVMQEIRGLDPGRSELVELTREGCGYLRALCADEWALFGAFFGSGEGALYQYLETLCDLLYDDLRPRILHEPRLTVLCEVCTVLQALMVLDTTGVSGERTDKGTRVKKRLSTTEGSAEREEEEDEESASDDVENSEENSEESSEEDDEDGQNEEEDPTALSLGPSLTSNPVNPQGQPKPKPPTARLSKRLHIAALLRMVLQDAQTRLVFKAQAVLQSEIRWYVPVEGDVEGSLGLGIASATQQSSGTELSEKERPNPIFESVSSALAMRAKGSGEGESKWRGQETWYPTLRKTVWVLGQLRDFVKPAIFEDIAQEALSYCRLSLVNASEMIASASIPSSSSSSSTTLTSTTIANANAPGTTARTERTQEERMLDAALFLVRHVLILKEVYASLEELRARDEGSAGGVGKNGAKSPSSAVGMGSGMGLGLGSARALDFGLSAGAGGGGVTETLSNMLSKTTSLLPEGLFASLGVTRGVESDMRGVKLDIDRTLRKACEDVIEACAGPVCAILDPWTDSHTAKGGDGSASAALSPPLSTSSSSSPGEKGTGTGATSTSTQDLPALHLRFLEALQRDLRASIARLRAYVEDERTVRVLVEHVEERVGACYERWGDVVGGGEKLDVLSSARLREMLRDVCAERDV